MNPLLLKAGAILALLAGVWLHGHHIGAAGVQADWDAEKVAEQRAADAAAAKDRALASLASSTYQAQRAEIAARVAPASPEASHALHAPACPSSAPLELGAVAVPGVLLDRLRRAGANPAGR